MSTPPADSHHHDLTVDTTSSTDNHSQYNAYDIDNGMDLDSLLRDVNDNLKSTAQSSVSFATPSSIHYTTATTGYSPNAQVILQNLNIDNTMSNINQMCQDKQVGDMANIDKLTRHKTHKFRFKSTQYSSPSPTDSHIDEYLTAQQQLNNSLISPTPKLANHSASHVFRTHEEAAVHRNAAMLYYSRALEYVNNEQYYDAVLQYSHALDEWSDDPRIWCSRAMCYYYMEPRPMLRLALLDMNEAIHRAKNIADFYYRRACIYTKMEYSQQFNQLALNDYTMCLKLEPDRIDALTNRACIYIRMNQRAPAQQDMGMSQNTIQCINCF